MAQDMDSLNNSIGRHSDIASDSILSYHKPSSFEKINQFPWKPLLILSSAIAISSIPLYCDLAESCDENIQYHLAGKNKIHIDDFAQYLPIVSVYGLNFCGVRGLHNFKDRTFILATSYLIMGITVNSLKYTIRRLRPNGVSYNSFPSGHTATAFMGAEFLYQEYKSSSSWIGYLGYGIATGVGLLRIYNNAHYPSDIIAGAAIGILSTKIAYWLYPTLHKLFSSKFHKEQSLVASPFYDFSYHTIGFGGTFLF